MQFLSFSCVLELLSLVAYTHTEYREYVFMLLKRHTFLEFLKYLYVNYFLPFSCYCISKRLPAVILGKTGGFFYSFKYTQPHTLVLSSLHLFRRTHMA